MSPSALLERRYRTTLYLMAAITVVALGVRTWDLGSLSISHPEGYAPGIPYPPGVTQPIQRTSVETIVRSSFLTDNHPPGYYLLLLPWSQWVHADIGALRLPSAILGALAVPLLFLAARRLEGTRVAVFASAWLALHGTHVFWSRSARMWALCTFAAVASAWAFTQLSRSSSRAWEVIYVASIAVGLWSDYTFWPLAATQIICALAAHTQTPTVPRVLGLQAVAVILGTPVFMFLLSRLGSSAYLEAPVSNQLSFFLAFDAWFDEDSAARITSLGHTMLLALPLVGAAMTAWGVWLGPERRMRPADQQDRPLLAVVWLSLAWPAALVWWWSDQPFDHRYPVRSVTLLAPLAVAVAYTLTAKAWPRVRQLTSTLLDRWPVLQRALTDVFMAHALLPFTMLLAASVVMPALAPRSVLYVAPFVLLVASRGVFTLASSRTAQLAAGVAVTAIGVVSTWLVLTAPPLRDYKGLAASLESVRRADDVVVIENEWYAAPLHYYLPPDRVRTLTPRELAAPGTSDQLDRFWVVTIANSGHDAAPIVGNLPGFRPTEAVVGRDGRATLFVRR